MKYMLLIYIDEAKGAQVAKDLGETQMTAPCDKAKKKMNATSSQTTDPRCDPVANE